MMRWLDELLRIVPESVRDVIQGYLKRAKISDIEQQAIFLASLLAHERHGNESWIEQFVKNYIKIRNELLNTKNININITISSPKREESPSSNLVKEHSS